jgi:hypothetical protein
MEVAANQQRRSTTPLPSALPRQNPRLLPRLASCRTEYLLLCVASIIHYPFHLHLDFKLRYRANVNNNKRTAAKQRVTQARYASALFATALCHKVFCLCALSLCRTGTPATATTTAAMDLFVFYAPSGVLLCKPCGYAVPPTALATYISIHHLSNARNAATSSLASSKLKKPAELLANYLRERFQLLDPATAKIPTLPLTDPPIPEL